LLSGLLDANCDKAEEYREESDGWRTKDSVLTHRILPSKKHPSARGELNDSGKQASACWWWKDHRSIPAPRILAPKFAAKIVKVNGW
jgi:hypothetical protein